MPETLSQIVYVLTNPAMPGIVKIGKTTQLEVDARMRQLYGTGVPVPFECAFACQVRDADEVERALHFAFGNDRLNPNREFFKIEPERVAAVLRLLRVDEITAQFERTIEADLPAADKRSAEKLGQSRRPHMNFRDLGIPVGAELVFEDGVAKVTIASDRLVEIGGEQCSLTEATRRVRSLPPGAVLRPAPFWTFEGKTIADIYERFHASGDEG